LILFSKPSVTKKELKFVKQVLNKKILTDGFFQNKAEKLIKKKINSNFIALTQSCTDALEMAANLIQLKPNDEVIVPSYTFTSTANAIVLRGAKPVFVDIKPENLQIDDQKIEKLITKKTKAIFVVHYGGNFIDLKKILLLKKKYNLFLIEDTAHSFLASRNKKFAGTIGDIGVFSFHETKNITGGQGGAISINNNKLIKRANFLLDKGTDRINFLKNYKKQFISENKIIKKKFYSWVDIGSEYRASELSSALIYSQLTRSNEIKKKRKSIWENYYRFFKNLNRKDIELLHNDKTVKHSYHLFCIILKNKKLIFNFRSYLQKKQIPATFHYVPLHSSKFGKKFTHGDMSVTNDIWNRVVRFPLYPDLTKKEFLKIINTIKKFFINAR